MFHSKELKKFISHTLNPSFSARVQANICLSKLSIIVWYQLQNTYESCVFIVWLSGLWALQEYLPFLSPHSLGVA